MPGPCALPLAIITLFLKGSLRATVLFFSEAENWKKCGKLREKLILVLGEGEKSVSDNTYISPWLWISWRNFFKSLQSNSWKIVEKKYSTRHREWNVWDVLLKAKWKWVGEMALVLWLTAYSALTRMCLVELSPQTWDNLWLLGKPLSLMQPSSVLLGSCLLDYRTVVRIAECLRKALNN